MSLIMKEVRVVGAGTGGGVVLAALALGVRIVGEELDAAPLDETELRGVGRLLLLVQRAVASGLMPKLKVAGLPSVR